MWGRGLIFHINESRQDGKAEVVYVQDGGMCVYIYMYTHTYLLIQYTWFTMARKKFIKLKK
jgi:hypothetical protein